MIKVLAQIVEDIINLGHSQSTMYGLGYVEAKRDCVKLISDSFIIKTPQVNNEEIQ